MTRCVEGSCSETCSNTSEDPRYPEEWTALVAVCKYLMPRTTFRLTEYKFGWAGVTYVSSGQDKLVPPTGCSYPAICGNRYVMSVPTCGQGGNELCDDPDRT